VRVFLFFWARDDLPSLTQLRACGTIGSTMTNVQARTERRSLRLWMSIAVRVSGKNADGRDFSEETETIMVNAQGGQLFLHQPMKARAEILVTNLASKEEQACRVVTQRDPSAKGMRVGIEFLLPSPRFWGVEFPPDEWSSGYDDSASRS
jgi:hypothetical protein